VTEMAVLDRLMSKVVWNGDEDECWTWEGAKVKEGYGVLTVNRRGARVHRVTYEAYVGPIPEGFQIDHLCRNTACCNPAHLEAVTPWLNTIRSNAASALNLRKTHCVRGHLLDGDNLLIRKDGKGRECRACKRRHNHARYQKEAAA